MINVMAMETMKRKTINEDSRYTIGSENTVRWWYDVRGKLKLFHKWSWCGVFELSAMMTTIKLLCVCVMKRDENKFSLLLSRTERRGDIAQYPHTFDTACAVTSYFVCESDVCCCIRDAQRLCWQLCCTCCNDYVLPVCVEFPTCEFVIITHYSIQNGPF